MTLPVVFTANGPTGYNLTNSLRFRSSASAYLNRTFTNEQGTYTLSLWVKRGTLGVQQEIVNSRTSGAGSTSYIEFNSSDQINIQLNGTSVLTTTAVYRDPASWYQIILSVTASATSYLYVNGTQIGSWTAGANPFLFSNGAGYVCAIGRQGNLSAQYFDGYMAEINYIDGQALTPSSFGSFNALTGVWQPARYTGTYGTNGFYLPFTDNSALTTSSNVGLGKDFSGNGNYWTTNNISITAGATYDSMTDVPTLTSATTANYATLNPLDKVLSPTVINGNLSATVGDNAEIRGTIYVSSGKWYWEIIPTTMTFSMIGIGIGGTGLSWGTTGVSYYGFNGNKYLNGTASSYGASYTNNDVIGVALDLDNLQITFYKNNTSQGTITGLTAGLYAPALSAAGNSSVYNTNFGQQPFSYTPPTGFVALNTFNLPNSTIVAGNKQMDMSLYTGTGAALSVTNAGSFQPDLVWVKGRSGATDHALYDSVRGVQNQLESNTTTAETTETTGLTAFGINGFTVGALAQMNTSAATYVGWQWKAGGAAVTNTAGTISAQVSANTTSGFSVVTYTGNGTAGATIGHGLGVAPSMVIAKNRSTGGSAAYEWTVYHVSLGATKALFLNDTGAAATDAGYWYNTAPTSSVITVPSNTRTNVNGSNFVFYCFAQIAGYSAMGSYVGNGVADGPFIYTGFRPRYFILKNITSAQSWSVQDTSRSPYNVGSAVLLPNSASAELTGTDFVDILSNGFKIRHSSSGNNNNSGDTYIYMAFAENPFKNALAR